MVDQMNSFYTREGLALLGDEDSDVWLRTQQGLEETEVAVAPTCLRPFGPVA
jgi:hypothetical protein